MKRIQRLALAACGVGVVASAFGTGIAVADPSSTTTDANGFKTAFDRPLQGFGSDTTEEVMNGLADVVVDGSGNKILASWGALAGKVKTRATGCEYAAAPNGSGAGVTALVNSLDPTNAFAGCVDFARSSSNRKTAKTTFIPFATDAVGFAVTSNTNIGRKLSLQDLKDIYSCTYPGFTGANPKYRALLPQAGSGTRSYWVTTVLGFSSDTVFNDRTKYACIADQTDRKSFGNSATTTPIQEHAGNVLNANTIVPISVSQYIAQSQGAASDVRGNAILGTILDDSGAANPALSYPMLLNGSYGNFGTGNTGNAALVRDVYNVVPTALFTNRASVPNADLLERAFVGSTSEVCKNDGIVKKYGLLLPASCGDTSLRY